MYLEEDLTEFISNPFPWKKLLADKIEQPPDSRSITFVFDPVGAKGKSTFAKHYCWKQKGDILSWDRRSDLYHTRRMNRDKEIVFFDFTRSVPKSVDLRKLYSSIETIKNGVMFSAKYESDGFVTACPHVVILSNFLLYRPDAISIDRWDIYRIGAKYKTLIKMYETQCNDVIDDYSHHEKRMEILKKERDTIKYRDEKHFRKTDDAILRSVYRGYFNTSSTQSAYKPLQDLLDVYGD